MSGFLGAGRCGYRGGGPAGGFFGVVAGFAESGAVGVGGGAAVVPGDDVVVVADGGVAVGGAAGLVPGLEEAAESGGEESGAGVQCGEVPGAGGGVEPAEPDGDGLGSGSVASSRVVSGRVAYARAGVAAVEELAGPAGGDGAVAGEPGGLTVALEQGAVGHDELDFDPGDPAGGAGDPFGQGVGHELPAAPRVAGGAGGAGGPGEGGVRGDAGGGGEQGGEVGHGVGGGAEADVPVGRGVAGAFGDGPGVPPVRGRAGRGGHGPVPGAGERPGVGGEFGIHRGPVRR